MNLAAYVKRRAERPSAGPFHHYHAFGMTIVSQLVLPELQRAPACPDCDLRIEIGASLARKEADRLSGFEFDDRVQTLTWKELGEFRIEQGRSIVIRPVPGVTGEMLAFALLGPVMAMVLQVNARLVLHGSAVAKGDTAVAFLGDKGAGKSTTAAEFIRSGYELLTDDLIAIRTGDAQPPTILPAFPQLKLFDAAADAVGVPEKLRRPPIALVQNKERYLLSQSFATDARVPAAIFLLARGDRLERITLSAQEKFKGLLRFSYATRFGAKAMWPEAARRQATLLAHVANRTPIFILRVPDDLARLHDLVTLVEETTAAPD